MTISKDKPYIDKYNSLDELEEDIYGNITHIDGGEWTTKSFKEVYESLDKEKFLIKINQAIKKYGNMISVYGGVPFCIRTDEKIHLLSYLKGLHPNERIETWDMVYNDELINEMWTSRPEERIITLADLSDGVIARIKFYNANKEYTVDSFKLMFEDYKKSIYCCQDFVKLCQIINDYDYIVNYINQSHFKNELAIFTPKFDSKRTHHIRSYKSDEDILQVEVISDNGVVKSYNMAATGMTMQDLLNLIDKERNEKFSH